MHTIQKPPIDRIFLILIGILVIFGLLMVYEATVVYSDEMFGGKYYFLILQTVWIVIGIIGMRILSTMNLDYLKRISPSLFAVILALLIFVLIPTNFSPSVYGAQRWIVLNPKPFPLIPIIGRVGFQPSELAKLVSIIFFASFLSSQKIKQMSIFKSAINFNLALLLVCGLIIVEPDFTTAFVLGVILVTMYFLSNANLIYFMAAGPLLVIVAAAYAFSSSYRRERIQTLLNPESIDKMGAGYHIRQVMIALGSGGLFGLGLGHSRQKYAYLPEVAADSIFAVIGEELGFIGTLFVIILFCAFIIRGIGIAQKASDQFGTLLVSGVMAWISVQTLINLGAMTRILPLTGVPLPLISYGGSSAIFILWGLGLVLNVSRHLQK